MRTNLTFAAGLAFVAAMTFNGLALAHGQSVTVQPASAKPGDSITISGTDLGGNRKIDVVVIGMGKETLLGTTTSNPQGAITAQFTLPKELMPGSYQLRAKGKENADTDLTIAAAPVPSGASMQMAATPELPVRERSLPETALLVDLFGIMAGFGLFFARVARDRAERRELTQTVSPAGVSTAVGPQAG